MARRTLRDPTAVVARRGGAWFIDTVLCGLAGAVPALLLADAYELNRASDGFDLERHAGDVSASLFDTIVVLRTSELAITLGALAVGIALIQVVLPGRWGWSPGHLAADLRIVRRDGDRVGIGRALLRTLGWVVDGLPGLPIVGYLAARLTRRHQRVGDLLARTYVVDKRAAGLPIDRPLTDEGAETMVADYEEEHESIFDETIEREQAQLDGELEPEPDPDEVVAVEPAETAPRAVAAPPDGVPPDQPIWDRRNQRYVLWHSKAGRWLTHTEAGWAPFEQSTASDARAED